MGAMMRWYSLYKKPYYGGLRWRGNTQDLFNHDTIVKIAEAHNKTSARFFYAGSFRPDILLYRVSSNPKHIAENFDIFDFELSDDEMSRIADMNTGERYETW